jgi:hypothetical protein
MKGKESPIELKSFAASLLTFASQVPLYGKMLFQAEFVKKESFGVDYPKDLILVIGHDSIQIVQPIPFPRETFNILASFSLSTIDLLYYPNALIITQGTT